ncbi:MAG: bifunctional helix-turn-helix transcriptional regulator/GNAT family N-acetyltransferase [Acidobacteriota bacterium]|nr:bifunctional helix-turn-helix transcriptional regulator/GNAT family N-acetyltransferase [Acidobacteriota bacterium]
MSQDFLADLGFLSFVTRLKRLSDNMLHDGRRLYRDLGMDIEPNWYAVFKLLEQYGPLTVGDIARRIGFSHPSVVSIVNKMHKAGYLEADKSGKDNRKRIMKLSRRAVDMMPEFEKVWAAGTASLKKMLPETDALAFLSLLEDKIAKSGFRARTLDAVKPKDPVSIELYSESLAPCFGRLNYEWIEEMYEVEEHDREQLDNPETSVIGKGGQIFFALVDGQAVGTVAMIPEGDNCVELAKMAVTNGYRGYGIGDKLMEAFIEYARKNGFERIVLESNRKQVPAIQLYRKFGFREIPLNPETPYSRADIRMELLLTSAGTRSNKNGV